jgi:hypothetical protein
MQGLVGRCSVIVFDGKDKKGTKERSRVYYFGVFFRTASTKLVSTRTESENEFNVLRLMSRAKIIF